jgi:hypothetical protein
MAMFQFPAANVPVNGAGVLNETLALPVRTGDYDLRYQVRESQPVIVQ